MDQNPNYNIPAEEEEGLDIMALVKSLWAGRKTVIIWTVVFMVLGLVAALTMTRTYSVSTVMVPQVNSTSRSSLSSLASLAGFDLGTTSSSDISPLVYPQIVSSVNFRKELIYTPYHFEKADSAVTLYTYATEIAKPSVGAVIKKYTIGLPFTLMKMLRKEKPEMELPAGSFDDAGDDAFKPVLLTRDEEKLVKEVERMVSLAVDKKEGYITLNVNGTEPIVVSEMAIRAQQLLQEEVTRMRTEKSQNELDYVQDRYDEIKKEAESLQAQLATVKDRSQNMTTTRAQIEMDRIQSKYSVANSIYAEMAKQLEQAKMKVKRDSPVYTVIQPVTVPTHPSNSRAKTLVVWVFLGFVLGCGVVLLKGYMPKIKEMLSSGGEKEEATAETRS